MHYKNLVPILFILFCSPVFSQQFAWQKTLVPGGKLPNDGYPSDFRKIEKYSLSAGDRIIVSYLVLSENIDVDPGAGVNLLQTSGNMNDAAFSIFDVNGNVLRSQIIQTPNEYDIPLKFCYDSKNKLLYALFSTRSDSVRFTPAGAWHRINKQNRFTMESFLLKFDSIGNFLGYFDFSTFNGSIANHIEADTSGHIYISGNSTDSLIFRNTYYPRNSTGIKGNNHSYLMRLNENTQVDWITFTSTMYSIFKMSGNKLYVVTSLAKDSAMNFKYFSGTGYSTASTNEYRNILYEVDLSNGEILDARTLLKSNLVVGVRALRIGKNNLLLLTQNSNSTPVNLVFDSETKVSRGGIVGSYHLSCFSMTNYGYQFTNIYDSTSQFNISEIYNDTSYSISAASNGNRLLSFKGQKIYSSDYLSSQPLLYGVKPFFATYSTNNYLKNLWYFNPQAIQSSLEISDILAINKDVFMVGNVALSTNLALGSKMYSFTGNKNSTTLLKYNCKPTAFFSYKSNGKKVDFKNLSLSSTTYLWKYGILNHSDTVRNPTYSFPSIGGTYYPQLIVSNDCGKDTFSAALTTTANSINMLDKNAVRIYPNPASSNFAVNSDYPGLLNLTIYDLQGKAIYQSKIKDSQVVETNNWANGVYLILLSDEAGAFYSFKLILGR